MEPLTLTHILVVEDNLDDSFLLTRQIQKAQIDDHVAVIEDGREALDYLQKSPTVPLAVFLDLRLPGLSGIELLRRIRQDARFHELPIIVMTGSNDPNDLQECHRLGVTAFLPKPVGLGTFIKTVAHLFPKIDSVN